MLPLDWVLDREEGVDSPQRSDRADSSGSKVGPCLASVGPTSFYLAV
jgi:hypothetical protein